MGNGKSAIRAGGAGGGGRHLMANAIMNISLMTTRAPAVLIIQSKGLDLVLGGISIS